MSVDEDREGTKRYALTLSVGSCFAFAGEILMESRGEER